MTAPNRSEGVDRGDGVDLAAGNVVACESQQDHRITNPPLNFPQASLPG